MIKFIKLSIKKIKGYFSYFWMKIPAMKKFEDLKIKINDIIKLTEDAISQEHIDDKDRQEYCHTIYSEGISFIEKIYGKNHSYYTSFIDGWVKNPHQRNLYDLQRALGLFKAVKREIDGGWIFKVKSIANAEVFNDILEMGEFFLEQGYKDASAIMVGGAMEGHIKQLCRSNDIPLTRTNDKGKINYINTEDLNTSLMKKEVYNLTTMKQVTAWLGLRNDAAHADYHKYTQEQVKNMYDGVLSFIALNPAE